MRPPHWAVRLAAARDDARVRRALANPAATQAALLRRILGLYRDTELGRALGLAAVDTPQAFAKRVRVQQEADFRTLYEAVRDANRPGTVTAGQLRYMARTGGTTGASKLVPFPDELIRAFKTFETRVALNAMRDLGRFDLLDGFMLITSSAPVYEHMPHGLTIGSSSGIMTLKAPRFARTMVRPTPDVLAMTDWKTKLDATARQALSLDVRLMTGVPVFAVTILERVLELAAEQGRPAASIGEVWPNLALYFWSGSSIALYERRLRQLFGPGVHFREIYSATESPMAYQHRDGEPGGLLLNLDHTYFEFQPPGAGLDDRRLGIAEVQVGVPYRIVVTTLGGLIAYRVGDLVEFVSLDPPCVRVLGREADEINLASEKMPLGVLEAALKAAELRCGVTVGNFFVAPTPEPCPRPAYHWYVELDAPADHAAFARCLDEEVRARHAYYDARREQDAVLGACAVSALPPGTLDAYLLETRAFGQGKLVRLHRDREVPDAILRFAEARAQATSGG